MHISRFLIPFLNVMYLVCIFGIIVTCTKPEPLAYKAKVGMSRKEVDRMLGEPLYSGGYVASQDSAQPYISQIKRFVKFQVYLDSSVVVLRQDTVVEIKPHIRPYLNRLNNIISQRRRTKQQ